MEHMIYVHFYSTSSYRADRHKVKVPISLVQREIIDFCAITIIRFK